MKLGSGELLRPVEDILRKIGHEVTAVMKSNMKGHVYKGELRDSVTWRTASNRGPIADAKDLIDVPPINCVDIGSKNDHAHYVEEGTPHHETNTDSDEFIAEMKAWGASKGFDAHTIYLIIQDIRENGTEKHPYAKPTHEAMPSIAEPIVAEGIKTFWASRRKV
jgi:hypothetical protein